jgi:hypothetical protein
MDLWKLAILAVIVVGLLLLLGSPLPPPKLPAGPRVEEGTFRILTPAGAQEEIFGIYPVDAGFRVVGLRHEKGKVLVEADLLYGPDWTPLAGTITQRHPQEARWMFAFSEEAAVIRQQVGARETVETLPLLGRTFPFDSDIVAVWDALLRAGAVGEIYLLEVRHRRVHKIHIGGRKDVSLRVLGRAVPAESLPIFWDGQDLRLYRQGDLLLGIKGAAVEAFLLEILPEGVREMP